MSYIKQYVFIFAVCILLVMLLTGCSVMQDKMDAMKAEQVDNTLCCVPDPDFPHSCDGWNLC